MKRRKSSMLRTEPYTGWRSSCFLSAGTPVNLVIFMMASKFGRAAVPVGCLLELVRHVQHARFVEIVADDLQAHRHIVFAEAAGDGHAGQAGQVHRDRI